MPGPSIAVVHLIRKANGIEPFAQFLVSYRRHADPTDHDLVLIFKDFKADEDAPFLSLLGDVAYKRYDFAGDGGLDIGPYVAVANDLKYDYFCFLNSFSQIEGDNWLTFLFNALTTAPQAGIVGATGSWESSGALDPPFPNIHVRSNGFMMSSACLQQMSFIDIRDKEDARAMESGPNSFTQQVRDQGKKPYLVDRYGTVWAEADWPQSATFRSGRQAGLMISDNRTRAFELGDDWTREYLYDMAWTGKPSSANPFKRHKLRHRLRRLIQPKRPQR
ncbi:hypothetical protein NBZ79_14335 [Sneathiella marina]|uniref:Glycosyltransferase 2-like domain-containing protein n=1 Tax=Sneathiella marina TaxID=2950108 RepID=A0ABY4W0E5_9PROT|nr:hypothetical protein [Sneathiella marina]USG60346.1 hypothetical protein NBZ79_14335 [Sneathiella marina]